MIPVAPSLNEANDVINNSLAPRTMQFVDIKESCEERLLNFTDVGID